MTTPPGWPAAASSPEPGRFGAVVLTGGTAARMDGADKAAIELDGTTLLARALAGTMTAVEGGGGGYRGRTTGPAPWAQKGPRGGGPAAALLAGVDMFLRAPEMVAVLAVDMPRVTAGTFVRLCDALQDDHDGALLVGDDGRAQPLCAVYRWAALDRAR